MQARRESINDSLQGSPLPDSATPAAAAVVDDGFFAFCHMPLISAVKPAVAPLPTPLPSLLSDGGAKKTGGRWIELIDMMCLTAHNVKQVTASLRK